MSEVSSQYTLTKELSKVLAKKGTIEILSFINEKGLARHKELERILEKGTTLTTRLNELTSLGILKKEVLNEKYRPTEYTFTVFGKKIFEKMEEIESLAR